MTQRIVIPGWRGMLVVDAYRRMPNGEARNKQVTDSYVDLAEKRGHSLANNVGASIRDELHRLSSDAPTVFVNWQHKRPDLFYRLEKGRWGLRPEVLVQFETLGIDDGAIIAGTPTVQPSNLILPDEPEESFEHVYMMEMMLPDAMNIIPGRRIIKIGITGDDPLKRKQELQTGNPFPIKVLFSARVRGASALENKLHNLLGEQRLRGEWFHVDANIPHQAGPVIVSHGMML